MLIDLQVHSTYSDGYLSPTELVKFLKKQGVKVAALTDHNTIGGWHEFQLACKRAKIKPIIGLELYVKLGARQLNLLWYNFDPASEELHDLLKNIKLRRRAAVRKFLLRAKNLRLDADKILDQYNHYIPVNRIVDNILADKKNVAMIKKQLKLKILREDDVIHYLFFHNHRSHLRESCVAYERVVKLRQKIGGQLILAHPGKNNQLKPALLEKLKQRGLDGIEVLSAHHGYGAVVHAQHLAAHFEFIASGGSDFHRFEEHGLVHDFYQYGKIDSSLLNGIEKIIK